MGGGDETPHDKNSSSTDGQPTAMSSPKSTFVLGGTPADDEDGRTPSGGTESINMPSLLKPSVLNIVRGYSSGARPFSGPKNKGKGDHRVARRMSFELVSKNKYAAAKPLARKAGDEIKGNVQDATASKNSSDSRGGDVTEEQDKAPKSDSSGGGRLGTQSAELTPNSTEKGTEKPRTMVHSGNNGAGGNKEKKERGHAKNGQVMTMQEGVNCSGQTKTAEKSLMPINGNSSSKTLPSESTRPTGAPPRNPSTTVAEPVVIDIDLLDEAGFFNATAVAPKQIKKEEEVFATVVPASPNGSQGAPGTVHATSGSGAGANTPQTVPEGKKAETASETEKAMDGNEFKFGYLGKAMKAIKSTPGGPVNYEVVVPGADAPIEPSKWLSKDKEKVAHRIFSSKEVIEFGHRGGAATLQPFMSFKAERYNPGKDGGPERIDEVNGSIPAYFDVDPVYRLKREEMTSGTDWPRVEPLTNEEGSFRSLILETDEQVLKPDVFWWRYAYERLGMERTTELWEAYRKRLRIYMLPPGNNSDKTFVGSRIECYYADLMHTFVANSSNNVNFSIKELPLLAAMKKTQYPWWTNPFADRAIAYQKMLFAHLNLYIPFNSFESTVLNYAEMRHKFPEGSPQGRRCADRTVNMDTIPLVSTFYGTQLSETMGLKVKSPLRDLLEQIQLFEALVLKLDNFYRSWKQGHRLIALPITAIERMERFNFHEADFGFDIPTYKVLQVARFTAERKHRNALVNTIQAPLTGLDKCLFWWADSTKGSVRGDLQGNLKLEVSSFTRNIFPKISTAVEFSHTPIVPEPEPFGTRARLSEDARRESTLRQRPHNVYRNRSSTSDRYQGVSSANYGDTWNQQGRPSSYYDNHGPYSQGHGRYRSDNTRVYGSGNSAGFSNYRGDDHDTREYPSDNPVYRNSSRYPSFGPSRSTGRNRDHPGYNAEENFEERPYKRSRNSSGGTVSGREMNQSHEEQPPSEQPAVIDSKAGTITLPISQVLRSVLSPSLYTPASNVNPSTAATKAPTSSSAALRPASNRSDSLESKHHAPPQATIGALLETRAELKRTQEENAYLRSILEPTSTAVPAQNDGTVQNEEEQAPQENLGAPLPTSKPIEK